MYLIVDLEATCWEVVNVPDINEIIDIGIVVVDSKYNVLGKWSSLVRPKINPKLSSFCKRHTSIKQHEVDSAIYFEEAISEFVSWAKKEFRIKSKKIPWYTWGNWDLKCLESNCQMAGINFPFGRHNDLKKIYVQKRELSPKDKCNIKEVLNKEGLIIEDKLHRGLADAIAAAMIAKAIF